ncbi:hypothetical protein LEN26_014804 [Aphanomyces euteiches]|nr:hypothetical protein LEN26_014804 [Aphanomyces euteiches]
MRTATANWVYSARLPMTTPFRGANRTFVVPIDGLNAEGQTSMARAAVRTTWCARNGLQATGNACRVEGDATYCTKGPICGDEGKNCPKKGDVAVADCTKTLKSYIDANSKCVAPADALCQKLQNGSWGCVLDRVNSTTGSPATTSSPTTSAAANDKQCSTNWSQCNGQNWPFGVCCQDPKFQCNKKNDYLSLCEPKDKKRVAEDAAVGPWQQCGGNGYVGDTTCTTGNKCVEIDEYYHQCQPETNESGQPTWSQCGGKDYTGETSCLDEDVCTKFDDNYSQCIPRVHRRRVE